MARKTRTTKGDDGVKDEVKAAAAPGPADPETYTYPEDRDEVGRDGTDKDFEVPIDVFVCIYESRPHHKEVINAWANMEVRGLVNLKFILSIGLDREVSERLLIQLQKWPCFPAGSSTFQRDRRIVAEINASTAIYVVADDDCVPEEDTVVDALYLMSKYEDFAILSPYWRECTINPWTPEKDEYDNWPAIENEDLMEHVDVGGIRFTRRGVMSTNPEQWLKMGDGATKYDRPHCAQIRAKGLRVGVMKHVHARHLGERRS